MEILQRRLENGIKVVLIPRPSSHSVIQLCMVSGGSMYESARLNGISHFLEHMMFKGTKKRPTAKEVILEIEEMGAHTNAFTGNEFIGFYVQAPEGREEFTRTTDILSDQLLNSTLPNEEIEKEKGAVLEEIHMYDSSPSKAVKELLPRLLYGEQAAGRTILGPEEVIKSLQRRQLVSYVNKYINTGNMVIVVAGNIPDEKYTLDTLNKFYGPTPAGEKPRMYKLHPVFQAEPEVLIKTRDIAQSWLALAVRAPSDQSDEYPVLKVLDTVLGTGMSSRLFSEVRERRGLAYSVGSYADSGSYASEFVVHGGVNISKIEEALQVIREELHKISSETISEEELKKAKRMLRGGLKMSLDGTTSLALGAAVDITTRGCIESPEEFLSRVDSVSVEDVRQFAETLFQNNNLNLAVVGPYPENLQEEFKDIISI